VSMAAVAMAISGGGALSSLETTVLLTVDETLICRASVGRRGTRCIPATGYAVSRDLELQMPPSQPKTAIRWGSAYAESACR
jgi:hypothetical protein